MWIIIIVLSPLKPVRMKILSKILVLLIFTFTLAGNTQAQKLDLGLLLGGSYYYGDVVNELEPSTVGAAVGGFLRYRLGGRVALKGYVGYNSISGDDKLSESKWQQERNWTFETSIIEASLQAEFNLIEDRNRGRRFANPFIPYLFAGVGTINFTPKSEYNGVMTNVAPLQLSGVAYATSAIAVPFGIGARFYASRNFQLGFEFGVRYTNTSYLDDIAPNNFYIDPNLTPNPTMTKYYYGRSVANKNPGDLRSKMGNTKKEDYGSNGFNQFLGASDLYVTMGVTAAYTFGQGGGGGGGRRGYGKVLGCPRFY